MNYSKICFDDTVNGNGFRTSLFVSGCSKHPKCEGCWNKDLWSHSYGKKYTDETEIQILNSLSKPWVKGLSILGGEPTDNLEDGCLIRLVKRCKELYPNKTIYCWSGYTFEELIKNKLKLDFLTYIDMLRDGGYIEELRDINQYLGGSKNQRCIDVQESLRRNEVVIWKSGER